MIEQLIIEFLLNFTSVEQLNAFLQDPRSVAVIVGALIAISGALLGTFLLLRQMALTSDAISHTVLLGIVVAFLVITLGLGMEADINSPWLIIGAATAGVLTVIFTEFIYSSGLVRQDAALGLIFPLMFAVAIILISRYVDDAHLDEDVVFVGEIGIAWADSNAICLDNCTEITITEDSAQAETKRQCVNCASENINPRDERAIFEEICSNCGVYTPAQAWSAGYLDEAPILVFLPRSIMTMSILALLTVLFVLVFYKELKLSTFDTGLAATLGFRPVALAYALMVMVSLVAVGAFDAVGSILVVAFFIIPPAAAYLLTDRLSIMLLIAPVIGALGAFFGYDLARGSFLGIIQVSDIIAGVNTVFGTDLLTEWDSSISANIVIMTFFFFVMAWVFSPRYGMIATLIQRRTQRIQFNDQVMLGHIFNHQGTAEAQEELAIKTMHIHFNWSPQRTQLILNRLSLRSFVKVEGGQAQLTERGEKHMQAFSKRYLQRTPSAD